MTDSAVHIIADGRVQGVGFRFFVRQHASSLGLTGWVRNCIDGKVEIHAEGEHATLELFIGHVRQGPTFGHVDDLVIEWTQPERIYSGFDITF